MTRKHYSASAYFIQALYGRMNEIEKVHLASRGEISGVLPQDTHYNTLVICR